MVILLAIAAGFFLMNSGSISSAVEAVVTKADFAVMLFNSCRRHLDVTASLLATAMGVFESGYGKSAAYSHGFNVFNITAGRGYTGATWAQENADDEFKPDGTKVRISQTWRVYSGIDQSVDDYLSFLSTQNGGRYKKAYASLIAGDAHNFVFNLYDAGYFTLAPEKYLAGVEATMRTVSAMNGLS